MELMFRFQSRFFRMGLYVLKNRNPYFHQGICRAFFYAIRSCIPIAGLRQMAKWQQNFQGQWLVALDYGF